MPKGLSEDAQIMVASLLNYFEQERQHGGPLTPLHGVKDRVAAALNVHYRTVERIAAKVRDGEPLCPAIKKPRVKPIVDIDDFNVIAIRNVIYECYSEKEHITLDILRQKLLERGLFFGGTTSLWKVLRNIGFSFRKDDPRRGLMELPNIAARRVLFLRQYISYKEKGIYKFIFPDETWIFQNGNISRSWQDKDIRSVKTIKSGGRRSIVLHAGGEEGFVDGAELVFNSKTNDADYHGEMNRDNFVLWFRTQLLPNLQEPSVIVMDNASYHSTQLNKAPTAANNKQEIRNWLEKNHIEYDTKMLKSELVALVKRKKQAPVYEVDTLAEANGHKVLRLPPYHCIFNPIEHIWGICKGYYNKNVIRNTGTDSTQVWRDALKSITKDMWSNSVKHAEAEITRWYNRDVQLDSEDILPLVISNPNEDSDYSDVDN